jgi:hypothetical protein
MACPFSGLQGNKRAAIGGIVSDLHMSHDHFTAISLSWRRWRGTTWVFKRARCRLCACRQPAAGAHEREAARPSPSLDALTDASPEAAVDQGSRADAQILWHTRHAIVMTSL